MKRRRRDVPLWLSTLVGSWLTMSGAGCQPAESPDARLSAAMDSLDLEDRIAQMLVVGVSLPTVAAADSLLERLSNGGDSPSVGGIWLDEGSLDAIVRVTRTLPASGSPPLIFGADLSGGVGLLVDNSSAESASADSTNVPAYPGEFPQLPTLLALLDNAERLEQLGRVVGEEAQLLGVTFGMVRGPSLLCSPDPDAVRSRRLTAGTSAYFRGLRREGLATSLQLLRSPTDCGALAWDYARLQSFELPMVRMGRAEGIDALTLGGAIIPALAADDRPAALSASVVGGLVRQELGWENLVIADLREMTSTERSPVETAAAAIGAGIDVLIIGGDQLFLRDSIAAAAAAGRIDRARIDESARRIVGLKLTRMANPNGLAPRDSLRNRLTQVGRPPWVDSLFATTVARFRADSLADDSIRVPGAPGTRIDTLASGVNPQPDTSVGLIPAAPASVGMSSARLTMADRVIQTALERGDFTAAALAVGRRGRLVRLRGYGTASGRPVDPRSTLFDIASLTKVVATTTAIALLVEEGALSLDDRASRYLPGFRGEGKEDVTIRHLLTHTSGIPSGLWLYGSASSAAGALDQVLEQPLRRPPGEEVEYSDLGMILLAAIVERVSESPLDQFIAERLLVPLGMQNTMFLPPIAFRDRVVPTLANSERPYPLQGVVHDGNSFRLGGVAGHAGLFSTAADMATFAQMWLGRGRYDPVRVLADSTVEVFIRRQPGADERALGWDTPAAQSSAGRYFSASSFGHTGYTGTSIWIDPATDLFVVLLTNRTYPETSPGRILDLRVAVHEAVARALTDQVVRARR